LFERLYPEGHQQFQKEEINISDLNVDEILLLQDGHFRDGILNLCKNNPKMI
jgi:LysR family hydrogen peroxide-inducible transcriptional activator